MILRLAPAFVLAAAMAASSLPVSAAQGAAHASSTASSARSASGAQGAHAIKEKGSYSLGVVLGTQLHKLGITPNSVAFDKVAQGMRDVVKGTAKASPEDQKNVQALLVASRANVATRNKAAARKFLAANAKRKGVKTIASGLQYRIIKAGSGASPHATDTVTVNYRGTLLDGTVFDSSYDRGMPATFPVDHVIQGWKEALVLMKPGSKWELYIPPQLAYGDDSPPPIPPGSLLKFEVELLKVQPAGTAAAPQVH
ncbi:MAG: FKBP-type peptidyl-prolyl cis-trans isomerase [Steroidobacteraceae bacterium]